MTVTDLILFNANVISMDPRCPHAHMVAVGDGKIRILTPVNGIQDYKGRHTVVIDCKGKTLLPGFIDSHCHLQAFAESLVALSLDHRDNVHSIAGIATK